MVKTIQLRIYPDGKIKAEISGIKGPGCTNYIGLLEDLLQAKVVETLYTDEYYETDAQTNNGLNQENTLTMK